MTDEPRIDEVIDFANNPEPRCACVLLLDTSGSMQGAPIDALNDGLQKFRDDLIKDDLASRRVEIAVVAFNSQVDVVQDFVTADKFNPPTLIAQGSTFMGTAINKALDMIRDRKQQYKDNGISYFRPWVFMITDGEPQGESDYIIEQASKRVKQEDADKRVAFFAVGVENANMARLQNIVSPARPPVKLIGLNFVEMFLWLSRSAQAVSHSKLDDVQVALPPPGWGTV